MKLLTYIFDKANLFVVFISMFILSSMVVSLFIFFSCNTMSHSDIIFLIKYMICVTILTSGMLTLVVRDIRLNDKFRSLLTVVSESITNVTTIAELENIRDVDIIELRKYINHSNHVIEIKNLNSLIELKIDTIKKITI